MTIQQQRPLFENTTVLNNNFEHQCIHSKSWISWMEKSADYLEFSAEETINFALSGELTLKFLPSYVRVLAKSLIKTYQHCMFSLKIKNSLQTTHSCDFDNLRTFWQKILASRLTCFFRRLF